MGQLLKVFGDIFPLFPHVFDELGAAWVLLDELGCIIVDSLVGEDKSLVAFCF